MIFSGFVYIAAYVLQAITSILPSSDGFPAEVSSAFTTFGGYVQILDTVLPLATLATVLAILFALDLAVFGFKTFKWLISHLPFVGGRG